MNASCSLRPGRGGLAKVVLTHPGGSRAEVYLNGAQLLSWRDAAGRERLFVSRCSRWEAGVPVRGGVPVVFPQFAGMGPLPKHGFAQTQAWELIETGQTPTGAARARFGLRDSPATRALWPHAFRAELSVALDEALSMRLRVRNPGRQPFRFTAAFHSYFRVRDLARVGVTGLGGTPYRDAAAEDSERRDTGAVLCFPGEVNRVYHRPPARLHIREPGRTLCLQREGFAEVVVWNPGADKASGFADLCAGEQRQMVCVEAAHADTAVRLAPGAEWTGAQRLIPDGSPPRSFFA